MISYNLDSIEKAKKLVSICEKYKDEFDVDVIHGKQIIDGTSILGVISLIGHIVSINISSRCNEKFMRFKNDIERVDNERF